MLDKLIQPMRSAIYFCPSSGLNFSYSVTQIRKQTGLKDGGEGYLFATTSTNNEKTVLRIKKFDNPMYQIGK